MPGDLAMAFITDVHANAFALEAVLRDVDACAPDILVNLGDQVWGQTDPAGAYAMQEALTALEVRGNNDEKLLLAAERLSSADLAVRDWLLPRLPAGAAKRLGALPLSTTLADGAVLAAHGTPRSAWDGLLWYWDGRQSSDRSDEALRRHLGDTGAAEVVVVGHTHIPAERRVGELLLVNAGPIAWQKDGDPRARWLLLTRRCGRWYAEQRRVVYDWEAAARAVRDNHPPLPFEADVHRLGFDVSRAS